MEADKRRYVRYEILDYATIEVEEPQSVFHAVIVDIGLGGLQLRTKAPLPVGCVARIRAANSEGAVLVLRSEIRHSMMLPDSDLFASGVRFVPETHDQRVMIAEYVHGIFQRQCDLLGG